MSYETPGFMFTLPASSELATDIALLIAADTSHVFRFVTVDSSGEIDYTAATGKDTALALACVGVIQDDPAVDGEPASIMATGISRVEAGTGGVTVGQRVTSVDSGTSAGRAVDVTNSGDDQIALGIALETAASGENFACLLMTPGGNRDAIT